MDNKNVIGKLFYGLKIIGLSNRYRAELKRSSKKLRFLFHKDSMVSFNEVREILTDPDVVKIFQVFHTISGSHFNGRADTLSIIVQKCVEKIPKKDLFPFAEFLVNDYAISKAIRHPDGVCLSSIAYCISLLFEKTPPEKKDTMADILSRNDFGRFVLGKKPSYAYIMPALANGLTPEEFDAMLSRTNIFADIPPNERSKECLLDKDLVQVLVANELVRSKPDIPEHKLIQASRDSYIDVYDGEKEKQMFEERAWKIVRIAFSHCKGETNTPEKNNISDEVRSFSYLDKNLLGNEKVVYRTKLHWIIFFWPIAFVLIAIIVVAFGFVAETPKNAAIVACIPLFFSILSGIRPFIKYLSSEFGITNIRIIIKEGFIRRNSLEALLEKIDNIFVSQSILGRLLNYGSIIVTTGGTENPFHKIELPLMFRKKVHEQIKVIQDKQ